MECAPLLRNGTFRVALNLTYVPIDFTHAKLDNLLGREGPRGPITQGELTKKAHKVNTR